MIVPVHPDFEVTPDFYESRFEGEVALDRRIFIIVVVSHLVRILVNRNVVYTVRKVLRANKKEKKNGTVRS
jgi:hypothetical protein